MSRGRAFTFTINVFDENTEAELQSLDCRYMIYGYELAPTTNRPHFQGYVYFDNARTITAVSKSIKGHIEIAKGAPEQNYDYCSKDGHFLERGQRPLSDKAKGVLQQERFNQAYQAALSGHFDLIPRDIYIRYRSTFIDIHRFNQPPPIIENLTPDLINRREWQRQLLGELTTPPDPRSIVWYTDFEGGKGKSSFADYARDHLKAWVFTTGKFADLAYLCPVSPPICILNLCNADTEIPYTFLESLKDGCVQSTKYEPFLKRFPRPHVVVFSNFEPDLHKLKADRWILRTLN